MGVGTAYRPFPNRRVLLEALAEPAFAEVIASPATDDATPETAAQRDEFNALAGTVLARARETGALRPGLTDEDLHHLVCGTAFALGLGPTPIARVGAYLCVLLNGVVGKAE
ncbi:hypothetical protein ACQPZZ_12700 [Microbispora sp. CA-135349]|uniref:SbtR family transcriptional regulator n=1 Tax=Microbispora sp. CA-135349 TaxID=3239953 RepID=UPI003D8C41A1